MNNSFKIIALLIFFPAAVQAAGSCCGAGSALVSAGHPALDRNMIFFQTGFDYGRTSSLNFQREAINFTSAYGITSRLALSLKSSYSWLQSTSFRKGLFDTSGSIIDTIKPDTTLKFYNRGFGDGNLGVQFIIIPLDVMTRQELKIGTDLGIPWGVSEKKTNVEGNPLPLPKKVQTGSGSYSLGGFVSYSKAFLMQKLAIGTTLSGRIQFRDKADYDPGDQASVLVSATAGPYGPLKITVPVNYRVTVLNKDSSGVEDTLTGGSRLDILPSLELKINKNIFLTADIEVPLWRDENQKANGNSFSARLSALFFIDRFVKRQSQLGTITL